MFKYLLIPCLMLMSACQLMAQADNESKDLTFRVIEQDGYLRDNSKLLETFQSEYGPFSPVDPRRFRYQAYQGLYIVEPQIDCPDSGCPNLTSEQFKEYYRPLCNYADACWHYIFSQDNQEKYQVVFSKPFWRSGKETRIIIRASEQEQNGLPLCIEYVAYDFFYQRDFELPSFDDKKERLVYRYCYNSSQNFYNFNKVYIVPIKDIKTGYPDFSNH